MTGDQNLWVHHLKAQPTVKSHLKWPKQHPPEKPHRQHIEHPEEHSQMRSTVLWPATPPPGDQQSMLRLPQGASPASNCNSSSQEHLHPEHSWPSLFYWLCCAGSQLVTYNVLPAWGPLQPAQQRKRVQDAQKQHTSAHPTRPGKETEVPGRDWGNT